MFLGLSDRRPPATQWKFKQSLDLCTFGLGRIADRWKYHGRVFALGEIKPVVATFGMPGERPQIEPSGRYDRFIEV